MIDKSREISFSKFYQIEFFILMLQKSAIKLDPKYDKMLSELSGYLIEEENIIDGLEKLARYQGTNELSIFLFDMVDRIGDYPAQKIYKSLPGLVEDFISLFELMTEDKESIIAVEKVLEDFRKLQPHAEMAEEKDVQPEEELLTFEAFYNQESLDRLENKLEVLDSADRKTDFYTFFNLLKKIDAGKNNIAATYIDLARQVAAIFPENPEQKKPSVLMDELDDKINRLVEGCIQLETDEPNNYRKILEEKKFPEYTAPVTAEEVPDEPLTVDSLLEEYFESEVDDYLYDMRQVLSGLEDQAPNTEICDKLIKQLRALKEISMIHGYNPIESVCNRVNSRLNKAKSGGLLLTTDTASAMELIFAELANVSQFSASNKSSLYKEKMESLLDQLKESFEKPVIPEIDETQEILIPYSDKKALFSILKDMLTQVRSKVFEWHKNIGQKEYSEKIFSVLDGLKKSTAIIENGLAEHFFEPLEWSYQIVLEQEPDRTGQGLEIIEEIWTQFVSTLDNETDLSAVKDQFEPIWEMETIEPKPAEQLFGIENTDLIASILADAEFLLWKQKRVYLALALLEEDPEAKSKIIEFLKEYKSKLQLIDFQHLVPTAEFMIELVENERELAFNELLVTEISKSFDLILDRLRSKGREDDCADILEVLSEIINTQTLAEKPVPEAVVPQPMPGMVDETDDVESIFTQECIEHTAEALAAVEILEKDSSNRQPLLQIENAIHSIRSSAFLLNRQNVVDLAVIIEEAAEMFASPDLLMPDDLLPNFKRAITDLGQLVEDEESDVLASRQALQQTLDQLTLEEVEEEPVEEEHLIEEETAAIPETEVYVENEETDEELLAIFQQESKNMISVLEKTNNDMKNDLLSEMAVDQFEYTSHSLKSAAMMLGFREIGQVTDSLENIIEAIKNKEITNTLEIQNNISAAIEVIKQLRSGEKIKTAELAKIIHLLDIRHIRVEPQRPPADKKQSARERVAGIFIEEARELIENITNGLIELEKMPESATLLTDLLRNLHTLKGSAMMVQYEKVGELTHKLEDYFQVYRKQNAEVKREMLSPAFTVIDLIQEIIESIREGQQEPDAKFTARMAEIDNKLFFLQDFDQQGELAVSQEPLPEPVPNELKKAGKDPNVIKIGTEYLDNLVNMATELVVNRTELATYFEDLKRLIGNIEGGKKQIRRTGNMMDDLLEEQRFDHKETEAETMLSETEMPVNLGKNFNNIYNDLKELSGDIDTITRALNKLSRGFEKNIGQISNLSKTLHRNILQVRMVPIDHLFDRFPRAARDLARAQKKRISLSVETNDAEMDRAMVEALNEPIMHLIRNAIDHGIEGGDERKQKKKTKTGNITLRARQEKSQVVIDVEDDGRGIDIEKVKTKIIGKKMASRAKVKAMSEAEILDFIFYPEFSTKDKTTNVSGRGLGLDIVANQLQKIKGIIRIRTAKDIGTTFSIRVPLTLVVSQALLTRSNEQHIAIPLSAVQESLEIEEKDILIDDNRKYIQVRGKLLPYIYINEVLKFNDETPQPPEKCIALVLHDAGISIALGIDSIWGRQEIVVKSLSKQLQNVDYIAGGTIMVNGEVGLILDYAAVIRTIENQFFGTVKDPGPARRIQAKDQENNQAIGVEKTEPVTQKLLPKKSVRDRKPRILIVDDSNSVRTFISNVLEKQSYITRTANEGFAALRILETESVDLVITDLEMPKMHGFDLIEAIRAQEKFTELPIVILTGKSGRVQRAKGKEVGANAFIGKPFKEGELLNIINTFIEAGPSADN